MSPGADPPTSSSRTGYDAAVSAHETTERALAVHRLLNAQRPSTTQPLPNGRHLALPDVEPPQADLVASLARRRSSYNYADEDMDLEKLSAWLRFSVGVQRFVRAFGVDDYPLSMAPSAGGLDILRAYVIVRRAQHLTPGVYRYEAVSHELVVLSTHDPLPALNHVYLQREFVPRAAVSVALTAKLEVAFDKYPLRHYRTLHVDSGVAVQNLYLVGTALGLSCCAVAGFDDASLAALLGLEEDEIPTMLFAGGHAA